MPSTIRHDPMFFFLMQLGKTPAEIVRHIGSSRFTFAHSSHLPIFIFNGGSTVPIRVLRNSRLRKRYRVIESSIRFNFTQVYPYDNAPLTHRRESQHRSLKPAVFLYIGPLKSTILNSKRRKCYAR